MPTAGVTYCFGPFRLDPAGYQFFCEGMPVPLAPKGLDLLLLLVTRPGVLVSKDEIMRTLWRDVSVTDNALTQVVSDLRRALSDDSLLPRYLQTVPRRGYRFIGSVQTLTSPQASPAADSTTGPHVPVAARAGVRETSSLEAFRAFTDGRLKLEGMDGAQVPAAIADFERAIALDPRYAPAYVGLAHARFWIHEASRAQNRPNVDALVAALADAHRAIDLDPDFAEAHAALALMLMSAKRPAEAVAAGRRAVALDPGNWRNHCRLGVAAWGAERLAAFERVLELYPDFAYAYYGMAMVHIARDQPRLAEDVLRRGLRFQDRQHETGERFPGQGLHWLLGLTRLAEGDTKGACEEFDRELASAGSGIYAAEFVMNAYDGLGFARLVDGDTDGARAMFARALDVFPNHARSLLGLATACHRAGLTHEVDAGIDQAARAVGELHSGNRTAEAVIAGAFCHIVGGRPHEAIGALEQLLAKAPPGFVGWTIPIEPFFAALRSHVPFQMILSRLAERAR